MVFAACITDCDHDVPCMTACFDVYDNALQLCPCGLHCPGKYYQLVKDSKTSVKLFISAGCPCIGCHECWTCGDDVCTDLDNNENTQQVSLAYFCNDRKSVLLMFNIQCLIIADEQYVVCLDDCNGDVSCLLECSESRDVFISNCPCKPNCAGGCPCPDFDCDLVQPPIDNSCEDPESNPDAILVCRSLTCLKDID